MKIKLNSIFVDNQTKALNFYTEVLGFKKSKEIPMGEFKWLTVTSPEGPADVELVLEPNANPAAKQYQESIFKQGIPITAFEVDDIKTEYERLKDRVMFTMKPTQQGPRNNRHFFRHLRQSDPALSDKTGMNKYEHQLGL